MPLIRVALDVPVARLFDYRCDDAAARVGCRVLVPFGKRRLIGVIVARPDHSAVADARIKPALAVLDAEPLLRRDDLWLIEFAAQYYLHPLGSAVMAALPAALRRVRVRQDAPAAYALTATGRALAPEALPVRALAQRRLLEQLRQSPVVSTLDIRRAGRAAQLALKAFIAADWVTPATAAASPAALPAAPEVSAAPPLNAEQQAAATAIIAALGSYQPTLLWGITGSGKTEVYLHAMAAALSRGHQVLLLVPEIALTPQLQSLVIARFPATPVAILHSGLGEGERAAGWEAARRGAARIVLGTRLSVYTPMPDLGLIIVDEEHDASFKQGEGFRYSARDLAVVRARRAGVPVVLGSATPALETYQNALAGRYRLLSLPQRIQAAPPLIRCIDVSRERPVDGLSAALLAAIADHLARGEQSLVFINRRGYAPVLMCGSCGWTSDCERCSAKLVLHLGERRLRCHHCGHDRPVPAACPDCGDADLAPVGQGTQRVEAALARHFPQARILRIDRDTVRRKAAWQGMRGRIRERSVDILVGTQILAKGHDFPYLNLVGVLNADGMLYSNDFRAGERLFAQLTQVAGRAGRGATRGRVLVQTQFPAHPLYAALCAQDFDGYARALLAERRQAGFPPFVHQALLRAEARTLDTALGFLAEAARRGRGLADDVTLYDPVPAHMVRKAGRERAHLLVQARSRSALRHFLAAWQPAMEDDGSTAARWSIDVDPADF